MSADDAARRASQDGCHAYAAVLVVLVAAYALNVPVRGRSEPPGSPGAPV